MAPELGTLRLPCRGTHPVKGEGYLHPPRPRPEGAGPQAPGRPAPDGPAGAGMPAPGRPRWHGQSRPPRTTPACAGTGPGARTGPGWGDNSAGPRSPDADPAQDPSEDEADDEPDDDGVHGFLRWALLQR